MIVIVDYGVGNLGSFVNMFSKIGINVITSSLPEEIEKANKIILPGVGSFDYGIKKLHEYNLVNVLINKVSKRMTQILGVCLGMQLFTESSEEGKERGLGLIKGETIKFDNSIVKNGFKVPHMGWNNLEIIKKSSLFNNLEDQPRYYFVHSYYVNCYDRSDVLAESNHCINFTAAFERNNIAGVQFHPEKSHKYGMKLLENFVKYF